MTCCAILSFSSIARLNFSTNEASPTETPLTIGYETDGESENLFQQWCNLTTLNLNRELNYTFGDSYIDSNSEGLFGEMSTLTNVTLGDQVKTLQKWMFAGSGVTSLNLNKVETIQDYALAGVGITELAIPGTVTTIGNNAFKNCRELIDVAFEYGDIPITIGYQPGVSDGWGNGPFYQSPLKYIKLDRDITYNANYAASCDGWDEGAFSNQYYSSGDWTARVIIGEHVTTLPKYMFATMRMTELHIPSNVENIAKGVVDDCEELDAVVFYGLDATNVPTLEEDAFAEPAQIKDLLGYFVMWKYYLFIPKKDGCKDIYLGKTGWSGLGDYLFSSRPTDANEIEKFYKYQDYEWYLDRYHYGRNPLPPTE